MRWVCHLCAYSSEHLCGTLDRTAAQHSTSPTFTTTPLPEYPPVQSLCAPNPTTGCIRIGENEPTTTPRLRVTSTPYNHQPCPDITYPTGSSTDSHDQPILTPMYNSTYLPSRSTPHDEESALTSRPSDFDPSTHLSSSLHHSCNTPHPG